MEIEEKPVALAFVCSRIHGKSIFRSDRINWYTQWRSVKLEKSIGLVDLRLPDDWRKCGVTRPDTCLK